MTAHIHLQLLFSVIPSCFHVPQNQIPLAVCLLLVFGFFAYIFRISFGGVWKKTTWHIWVIWIEWEFAMLQRRSVWQHKECMRDRKKSTSSIFGKLRSSVKWSAVCRAGVLCVLYALQALNPNSWINVFSCSVSCMKLWFFFLPLGAH